MIRYARALVAVLATLGVAVLPATPASAGPRDQQWYLDELHVPEAHRVTRGDGATIGLLTNAFPAAHPDLDGRVLPVMRRKGGLLGGVVEAPADYPVPDPLATAEMGLMVAGGGAGLLGVAPGAKVRPVICPGLAEDTDACLRWLVDDGVDVIDLSQAVFSGLGSGFDGIRYALAHDVVVVLALKDGAQLPAAQRKGVILVGGLDRGGKLAAGATPDNRVTVRAPGGDPVTSGPGSRPVTLDPSAPGGYGAPVTLGGDRAAAALVTGVVALIRARDPALDAPTTIDRLLRTAKDLGPPGRDDDFGHGLVDAGAAVTATTAPVASNPLGDPDEPANHWITWQRVLIAATVVLALAGLAAAIAVVLRRRRRNDGVPVA
ncbi:S8 family serine peptidase [Pseudosporangium ferrugineum]|uniref:Peptidase S8/S53 domain-containing protein n=1 Tax=Pseudosporangium ferrugineum TaxID=439699 RepID=A0A2T0RLE4_9ACTN|nr:S8 family serine peptidase [Pseudosporangium ferrugineum]PRY22015.1 hypothetical protein CLV70_11880 [Pseudosporangium ferrugineum]